MDENKNAHKPSYDNAGPCTQLITAIKPIIDHWIVCPCEGEPDFDEVDGFLPLKDGVLYWVGPTKCPYCGQELDLSELNMPDMAVVEYLERQRAKCST